MVRQFSGNKIEKYALPGVERPLKAARLLRDRNGALWVGTYDQGLLRVYRGKTSRFTQGESLTGEIVTALFEDREGSVWVGTTNGVDRFRDPSLLHSPLIRDCRIQFGPSCRRATVAYGSVPLVMD